MSVCNRKVRLLLDNRTFVKSNKHNQKQTFSCGVHFNYSCINMSVLVECLQRKPRSDYLFESCVCPKFIIEGVLFKLILIIVYKILTCHGFRVIRNSSLDLF